MRSRVMRFSSWGVESQRSMHTQEKETSFNPIERDLCKPAMKIFDHYISIKLVLAFMPLLSNNHPMLKG